MNSREWQNGREIGKVIDALRGTKWQIRVTRTCSEDVEVLLREVDGLFKVLQGKGRKGIRKGATGDERERGEGSWERRGERGGG